eukprot:106936_1
MEKATNSIHMLSHLGLVPPIIVSIGYCISIQLYQPSKAVEQENISRRKKEHKANPSFEPSLLNIFIFIHNVLLCAFSVACFVNTFPILYSLVATRGLHDGLCGIKEAFTTTSWGYWSYVFYLSKYYEVVDTYVVMLKGRRPSNLQVYHHIGAMIGCALWYHAESMGSYTFIVPNSFVHSIMYFYYALSVLKIKVPFKSWITTIQMIQFLFAHCSIIYILFHCSSCQTFIDTGISIYHFVYITWLFYMFQRFYDKTYKKKERRFRIKYVQ